MEIKKILIGLLGCIIINLQSSAQDVNATVIVNASAISGVDLGIFKTLQQSLANFINQRKWSNEEYASNEKIECNFQLTVTKKIVGAENAYDCKLSVQASRPIYGSNYNSTVLNIQDPEVGIRYVQFQPIDFNENRVSSSDALSSNLSAVMAYYVYMIIGLHQDSYKMRSGTAYYTKAQNIVNNAPEGSGITGWKADGKTNRYWKIENLLNTRFIGFREEFYNYHRNGLDQMYNKQQQALNAISDCIGNLSIINTDNPNTAVISLYFSSKREEYLQMIPQFDASKREAAINLLSSMDVANATKYRALLKP
jgi:hypothetical protein